MARMWETREARHYAFPVLAIHDGIVVEVPEERAKDAKAWLIGCMVKGMEEVLKEVPVAVAVEVQRTL